MTVDAGVLQNYIDVGAEDCGALIALGNTFANLAGPVTTALGVYLRARTGCASTTLATPRLFRDWRCLHVRVGAGQGLECAALRDGELAIPRRDRQLAVLRRHAPRPLTNSCWRAFFALLCLCHSLNLFHIDSFFRICSTKRRSLTETKERQRSSLRRRNIGPWSSRRNHIRKSWLRLALRRATAG